jgi:hypothetical protein
MGGADFERAHRAIPPPVILAGEPYAQSIRQQTTLNSSELWQRCYAELLCNRGLVVVLQGKRFRSAHRYKTLRIRSIALRCADNSRCTYRR